MPYSPFNQLQASYQILSWTTKLQSLNIILIRVHILNFILGLNSRGLLSHFIFETKIYWNIHFTPSTVRFRMKFYEMLAQGVSSESALDYTQVLDWSIYIDPKYL